MLLDMRYTVFLIGDYEVYTQDTLLLTMVVEPHMLHSLPLLHH